MYSIDIRNSNSIIEGHISIAKGKLNIKYGINGTGKSTIAKSISRINTPDNLSKLQSFITNDPISVSINPKLTNTLVFDDNFVNTIVFQDDTVINNAFEVFIKTADYDKRKQQLDERLKNLKTTFSDDNEVMLFIDNLNKLKSKFTKTKTGSFSKTGTLKSILSKQNIYNIPDDLKDYSVFLHDTDTAISWIDWRNKGDQFDIHDRCPFCSENVNRPILDHKKKKFQATYKKTDSQNLKEILELFEALKDYITPEKYSNITSYIKNDTADDVIMKIIEDLDKEYTMITDRFIKIEEFGDRKITLADISNIEKYINEMIFPVGVFSIFASNLVNDIFTMINKALDALKAEIEVLKKEMGSLKGLMQKTIKNSQEDINEFLLTAGIRYEIEIISEDENNSRTILKQCYSQNKTEVDRIPEHLSWGEKNAFALVLFMYYAISQNPDLIILDDPISSFDNNKKFAILQRMFKNIGKRPISFENKTVLLLTHDFEPITDFLVVGKLDSDYATASYIWNENGIVRETVINPKTDVKMIMKQCRDLAKDNTVNIVSRIAFLRKLSELNEKREDWGIVYQILSCLIHGTPIRRKIANNEFCEISETEKERGISIIKKYIPDFDYEKLLTKIYTLTGIKQIYSTESIPYFKVQLFRELREITPEIEISKMDHAWFKFIDETYHIESDALHYIDFRKFNVVPFYVLQKIDSMMNDL